jgi:hypothetical protein
MTASHDHHQVGALGDEAIRLVSAAQDWLHRVLADGTGSHIATGTPECSWCPICQTISMLRGDRQELAGRFGEVSTALSTLLRSVADLIAANVSGGAAPSTDSSPTEGSSAAGSPANGVSRVQRIDLRGED